MSRLSTIQKENAFKRLNKPFKIIGQGVDGMVANSGNKITKIAIGSNTGEYDTLKRLQGSSYVPRIVSNSLYISPDMGYYMFSMKKIPGQIMTVGDYKDRYPRGWTLINNKRRKLALQNLHVRGVSHSNLHENNQLVIVRDGKVVAFYIIDFGRSVRFPVGKTERSLFGKMPRFIDPTFGSLYNGVLRRNVRMIKSSIDQNKLAKVRRSIASNLAKLKSVPKKVVKAKSTSVRKTQIRKMGSVPSKVSVTKQGILERLRKYLKKAPKTANWLNRL
jgi:hypothetical protein